MSDFGVKLRAARTARKLSQEAFAATLGIHKDTQRNYENGSRNPDAAYLQSLVRLGVDVTYLLDEHGDAQRTTLTPEERHLIELYRRCDDNARDAVKVAIAAMAQVPSIEPVNFYQLKVEDVPPQPYAVHEKRPAYGTGPPPQQLPGMAQVQGVAHGQRGGKR